MKVYNFCHCHHAPRAPNKPRYATGSGSALAPDANFGGKITEPMEAVFSTKATHEYRGRWQRGTTWCF